MKRLLIALALLLAAPGQASAQTPADAETFFETEFDAVGDPALAWRLRDDQRVEVRACPPGGAPCTPVPESMYRTESMVVRVALGPAPVGTVFELTREYQGVTTTARTSQWLGRPTSTVPPALIGDLMVGAALGIARGEWSGGWSPRVRGPRNSTDVDFSGQFPIACRTPNRDGCWTVKPLYQPLPQRWAGWYLFVVEVRGAGYFSDGGWVASQIPGSAAPYDARDRPLVAYSAPRLACCTLPVPPPAPDSAPAPTASLRTRAVRSHGRLLLGKVECTLRCSVGLTVAGGGRTLTRTLSVEGPATLSIPPRRGRLRAQVKIDGKVVARGRVVAR